MTRHRCLFTYQAVAASPAADAVVVLTLEPAGPYAIPQVILSATALNGIVATNNGGIWPGVSNLPLPFP